MSPPSGPDHDMLEKARNKAVTLNRRKGKAQARLSALGRCGREGWRRMSRQETMHGACRMEASWMAWPFVLRLRQSCAPLAITWGLGLELLSRI
jgi:hypothetical protein